MEKPVECDYCDCLFSTKAARWRHHTAHKQVSHDIKPYLQLVKCKFCDEYASTSESLGIHVKVHHPDLPKPFKCPLPNCSKAFASKRGRRSHVIQHEEKENAGKFPCKVCPRTFPSRLKLGAHVRLVHAV